MNLNQISEAVESGKRVFWSDMSYEVKITNSGMFLICEDAKGAIALRSEDQLVCHRLDSKLFFVV